MFGGNFIHSYSIPAQLKLRQIEIDTKVPQRFRFPFFDRLNWYVADRYCSELRSLRTYRPKPIPVTRPINLVLRGVLQMAEFLKEQVDVLEDELKDDKARKAVFDRVPVEVKDPGGMVRELLWRVRRELGEEVQATGKRKLEEKMVPMSKRTSTSRPWSVQETPGSSKEIIQVDRGGVVKEGEKKTERWTQIRKREYQVDGKVIIEEQVVEFTETRTVVS